jgi:hypothetical protein
MNPESAQADFLPLQKRLQPWSCVSKLGFASSIVRAATCVADHYH